MVSFHRAVLVSLLFGLPSIASAACPGAFATAACNPNGVGNICSSPDGGYTVNCYLSLGTEDDYNTVSYYILGATNIDFKGYGYEADFHTPFCCEIVVQNGCAANPITLNVYGSGRQDDLNLLDTVSGQAMDCSISNIYGSDEDDTIGGSNVTTNQDNLYGESNSDVIHGREGYDYIDGGLDDDLLYGEEDDDIVIAGGGNDKVKGGGGDDDLDGGDQTDWVCGGVEVDTVDGGPGDNDIVTGETGDDVVNDGGTGSGDECENDSADATDCETITNNLSCPW